MIKSNEVSMQFGEGTMYTMYIEATPEHATQFRQLTRIAEKLFSRKTEHTENVALGVEPPCSSCGEV
jgi:hypothetical protein